MFPETKKSRITSKAKRQRCFKRRDSAKSSTRVPQKTLSPHSPALLASCPAVLSAFLPGSENPKTDLKKDSVGEKRRKGRTR